MYMYMLNLMTSYVHTHTHIETTISITNATHKQPVVTCGKYAANMISTLVGVQHTHTTFRMFECSQLCSHVEILEMLKWRNRRSAKAAFAFRCCPFARRTYEYGILRMPDIRVNISSNSNDTKVRLVLYRMELGGSPMPSV